MIGKNAFVNVGDIIEGWEINEAEDRTDKFIMEVISISQGGVYAMNRGPFSKPHKDAKFFKNGSFKIYEPPIKS